MTKKFNAMLVEETPEKTFVRGIKERDIEDLPPGDVLIRVSYSSLNYKDALSSIGNRGVTRKYPHTPGIDAAGIVVDSQSSKFKVGDEVIVTSYDLGMNTPGGFGQYIRVPAGWIVSLPKGLNLRESMIYGTAGFTAGMCVAALVNKVSPEKGEVLVSGATGGVGSVAVGLLAKLGYSVTAATGKSGENLFLSEMGAKRVIDRESLKDNSGRPLLKARWAGVVDTVGGDILSAAIRAADQHSIVTCCGNVASPELQINVFPFILRGVSLIGIDSQNCLMPHRKEVWEKLAGEWKLNGLEQLCHEIRLEQLDHHIDMILQGNQKGRVLVNLE